MAEIYQNTAQIRQSLDIFAPENGLFEIRSINGANISSGYFKDVEKLLKSIQNTRETWYLVMNEIDEACYSREQCEKILQKPKNTTKDADITRRVWILIDCDPVRASGVSSTDSEKALSLETARKLWKWLKMQGLEAPVVADSGNGYHLLYKIAAQNTPEIAEIIKQFLQVLDLYFSDEHTSIDASVFNASRVTKLYGTIAKKGENTPERPHRLSKIIHVPDVIVKTGLAYVKKVADMLPKAEPRTYKNNGGQFDLRDFMSRNGIQVKREALISSGTKFILEHCVFDNSHKAPDAAVFLRNDGAIGYKCFHNSCADYSWRDVRLKFEPDAYDDKSRSNGYKNVNYKELPNFRKREYKPLNFDEILANAPKNSETGEPEPVFLTTEQIRLKPDEAEEFIASGIETIDRKMRGLKKGLITCLSGTAAAGKSSLVSQFLLEAAQRDYRTALFSGELTDKRAYKWLIHQAAGKKHIRPTQFENYFVVNEECEEIISKWLDNKAFIYNNNYGNKFEFIREQLEKVTKEHRADLIILDNLMCMDIENLGGGNGEKNDFQTIFVKQLKEFAMRNNVHVLFVAHPRKSYDLIGMDDICGSSNMRNYVDNIFIIYRVTERYKKLKHDEFHSKIDLMNEVSNEIRICKDRDTGLMDEFIPLYFERESKRLKNSPEEVKFYGWQDAAPEITEVSDDDDLPTDWR